MSNREQIQEVQQQIESLMRKASDMEEPLERENQAGNLEEVRYLRTQLTLLYKESICLREKNNLLLRAQQGGGVDGGQLLVQPVQAQGLDPMAESIQNIKREWRLLWTLPNRAQKTR
ncbi:hypothetical protein ABBQ38_005616 [Trebouxia sp. C0009 RCD-2024]